MYKLNENEVNMVNGGGDGAYFNINASGGISDGSTPDWIKDIGNFFKKLF